MKEDILEQIVADWFVSQDGWFVKHNVKFRPSKDDEQYSSKQDSVHSDIDILAFSPIKKGSERVSVVTCKSWQSGFDAKKWLAVLEGEAEYNERSQDFQKREGWKYFRELVSTKWLCAFLKTLQDQTGQTSFTYYIAVTKLRGRDAQEYRERLENSKVLKDRFLKYGAEINIKIITMDELVTHILNRFSGKETTVVESTDIGRTLQLLKAAEVLKAESE
ncbi:hypothetical protein [Cellvibrio sp. pealriver]|uniref:hypothetical protein n=1 Tax=Cellvibrio sp. pealriver TaxID=1622269 RepID=UPI00066FD136|nr:hypothetical protein [Cellvibrio sp. pealriver]